MSNYAFFTETTCDCPIELYEEMGAVTLPLSFALGGKSYKDYADYREMSSKDFYAKMRAGEKCTTSQLSAAEIIEAMEPEVAAGKEIFYLAFSSGLSGTYQSACIAAEELREKYPGCVIEVVDSLLASMGEGLLAYYCGMKLKNGESVRDVARWARDNLQNFVAWFTVDDLMFLKRGGRLSGGVAVVGTVLGIKPVLHMDEVGHLVSMMKVRGRKASLNALVERYEKTAIDKGDNVVFISHGDSYEDAKYVADKVKALGAKDVKIGNIGPVIGSHSGPGTIALFFLTDNAR